MKYLLETSTRETNFIFNEKLYSHINGIAMGSPLGPLFANMDINYLENRLLRRLKKNGIIFWRRFVDDIFVIIRTDAHINSIIEILNSFNQDIVFIYEQELNNSL